MDDNMKKSKKEKKDINHLLNVNQTFEVTFIRK